MVLVLDPMVHFVIFCHNALRVGKSPLKSGTASESPGKWCFKNLLFLIGGLLQIFHLSFSSQFSLTPVFQRCSQTHRHRQGCLVSTNSIAGAGECSCPWKAELLQPTGTIVVVQEKSERCIFSPWRISINGSLGLSRQQWCCQTHSACLPCFAEQNHVTTN